MREHIFLNLLLNSPPYDLMKVVVIEVRQGIFTEIFFAFSVKHLEVRRIWFLIIDEVFVHSLQMTNDLGSGERGREMKNSDTDDDVDNGAPFAEEVSFIWLLADVSSEILLLFQLHISFFPIYIYIYIWGKKIYEVGKEVIFLTKRRQVTK